MAFCKTFDGKIYLFTTYLFTYLLTYSITHLLVFICHSFFTGPTYLQFSSCPRYFLESPFFIGLMAMLFITIGSAAAVTFLLPTTIYEHF